MPPKKKRRLYFPTPKPGFWRRHVLDNFSSVPAPQDFQKGHVGYIYLTQGQGSVSTAWSQLERLVTPPLADLPDADRKQICVTAMGRMKYLFKKIFPNTNALDRDHVKEVQSLCRQPFPLQVDALRPQPTTPRCRLDPVMQEALQQQQAQAALDQPPDTPENSTSGSELQQGALSTRLAVACTRCRKYRQELIRWRAGEKRRLDALKAKQKRTEAVKRKKQQRINVLKRKLLRKDQTIRELDAKIEQLRNLVSQKPQGEMSKAEMLPEDMPQDQILEGQVSEGENLEAQMSLGQELVVQMSEDQKLIVQVLETQTFQVLND